jgi:hypothetical protein
MLPMFATSSSGWDVESAGADIDLQSKLRFSSLYYRVDFRRSLLTVIAEANSPFPAKDEFVELITPREAPGSAMGKARDWYVRYLESAFLEHDRDCFDSVLCGLDNCTSLSISAMNTVDTRSWDRERASLEVIYSFLSNLAKLLIEARGRTFEDIVSELKNREIILASSNSYVQYQVVLVGIGWLTMATPKVLQSSYVQGPTSVDRQEILGFRDQRISQILRKFELFESALDPPPLYDTSGHAPAKQVMVAATLYFSSLQKTGRIKVEWTDQVPRHLQFDPVKRVLTLFALPSVSIPSLMHQKYVLSSDFSVRVLISPQTN